MKEMTISIKGLNDVYKFISQAQHTEGDITVRRGRYNVDGKSVMGIFSIDMSQDVTIIYPEEAIEFESFISQFQVSR